MKRNIVTVITDVFGNRIVVGTKELQHAIEEHFDHLPQDILLELIERILKDPTTVYEEKKIHVYHLFYRLDNGKYLVAVIKKATDANYFSTIYPTGKKIRTKHSQLKVIKK